MLKLWLKKYKEQKKFWYDVKKEIHWAKKVFIM